MINRGFPKKLNPNREIHVLYHIQSGLGLIFSPYKSSISVFWMQKYTEICKTRNMDHVTVTGWYKGLSHDMLGK